MLKCVLLLCLFGFFLSCSSTPPAQAPPAQKAPVIFVHGFLSKGYWLGQLEEHMAKIGHPTLRPTLRPADGTVGIEVLAQQLKGHIEQHYGTHQPIHLVGHSMGGLISRSYLEGLGGNRRALSLHTIATPHQGAPLSRLHPGIGGIQMRPGSQFLQQLNASPRSQYPETSYYTKADLIVPWQSSLRPHAKNVELPPAVHHSLPQRKEVMAGVLQDIRATEARLSE